MESTEQIYGRQGFGQTFSLEAPFGLLIVDFVNGFANPNVLGGGNISQAIARTVSVLVHARALRWPIAYSRVVFSDDEADRNVFGLKIPSIVALKEASFDSAIVDALKPDVGELVVRKTVPSAFFMTPLAPWFTQRGIKTLVVAGCVTSGCVRASVVDAMSFGFKPLVLRDCVGDRALGPHEANLFDMQQKYALVMDSDELLSLPEMRRGKA
ncbi:isochorismatase family protein [Pseudorhodoplanes sp.]|uniref:isochorismatase family protein n=1 Tax=Pseudorhodoplanes sp. TaxID=1934341 RepID=UPI003D0B8AC1